MRIGGIAFNAYVACYAPSREEARTIVANYAYVEPQDLIFVHCDTEPDEGAMCNWVFGLWADSVVDDEDTTYLWDHYILKDWANYPYEQMRI